jgi:hypothetical protein
MTGTTVPHFAAYLSAPVPLASGILTKIPFDAKDIDSDGWYDVKTHRFTPQCPGSYRVTVSCVGTGRALTISLARIYKNGEPIYETSGIDVRSQQPTRTVSAIIAMNGTTDYVEGWAAITGGNPVLAGGAAPRYTWFDAHYIGP